MILEQFLDPKVNKLINDPSELIDLDKAVDALTVAIVNKNKIGIIGDYDVDGTTSAALLKKFLEHYNIESSVYIPDRLKDGYGPNIQSFKDFKESGIDTVITVDCGATSIEVMEYAHENDIDVIIIDHHKVDGKLPKGLKGLCCYGNSNLPSEKSSYYFSVQKIQRWYKKMYKYNQELRKIKFIKI